MNGYLHENTRECGHVCTDFVVKLGKTSEYKKADLDKNLKSTAWKIDSFTCFVSPQRWNIGITHNLHQKTASTTDTYKNQSEKSVPN